MAHGANTKRTNSLMLRILSENIPLRRSSTPAAWVGGVTTMRFLTALSRSQGRRFAGLAVAFLVLGGGSARTVGAQDPGAPAGTMTARRPEVTRAELDSLMNAAEREAATLTGDARTRRQAEAAALRARLQSGDFFQGDRLILAIEGGPTPFSDTVVVGGGQSIALEGYPEISLRGVLRSEVREHVARALAQYIRTPVVTAQPLLRLTVEGGVSNPGFFVVPSDVAITDVIMQAGGPRNDADLAKTVIRRAANTVWSDAPLQDAIRRGLTVDQLGLHAGDVIEVGVKKTRNMTVWIPLVTAVASLAVLISNFGNR